MKKDKVPEVKKVKVDNKTIAICGLFFVLFIGFVFLRSGGAEKLLCKDVPENYEVQTPYDYEEKYTVSEPYIDQECRNVQIPKNIEDCKNVSIPYSEEVCENQELSFKSNIDIPSCTKICKTSHTTCISWFLGVCTGTRVDCDEYTYSCNVDITNLDSVAGEWTYQWNSHCKEAGVISCKISGETNVGTPFLVSIDPTMTKKVNGYISFTNENEQTLSMAFVQKPTKKICQFVTKYRSEQQCSKAIEFVTEQQCENVTKYRNVEKTRTTTKYKTETRTRTVRKCG